MHSAALIFLNCPTKVFLLSMLVFLFHFCISTSIGIALTRTPLTPYQQLMHYIFYILNMEKAIDARKNCMQQDGICRRFDHNVSPIHAKT
jgi:hypothetical protein